MLKKRTLNNQVFILSYNTDQGRLTRFFDTLNTAQLAAAHESLQRLSSGRARLQKSCYRKVLELYQNQKYENCMIVYENFCEEKVFDIQIQSIMTESTMFPHMEK